MSVPNNSPPTTPSSSWPLAALRHNIARGRASHAVSLLPSLSRAGLRAPFPLLSSLAHLLLHRAASPCFPFLAHRLLLYLRFSGLAPLLPSSTRLANHVLSLRFLLRRPDGGHRLFTKMPRPNTYSYNVMLAGYARLALAGPAASLFATMPHRDLVSYNAALLALASGGAALEAMVLYSQLRRSSASLEYSHYTFSALLVACTRPDDWKLAGQIHAHLALLGFLSNVVIASSIVGMCNKCDRTADAGKLFDEMPVKDVHAWTTMVYGYARDGSLLAAARLFDEMPERNIVSFHGMPSSEDLFAADKP